MYMTYAYNGGTRYHQKCIPTEKQNKLMKLFYIFNRYLTHLFIKTDSVV